MGSLQRFLKVNNPLVEIKRFRSKINIQRPRAPFFLRQLVEKLTLPKMPAKNYGEPIKLCTNLKTVKSKVINNPFERILARECANWFHNSHMIVFLHLNSSLMRDRSALFAELRIQNMHIRSYGRKIMGMALENTPYECVLPLYQSHTEVIFSEKVQIAKMCQLIQKCPKLVLMGAIVYGRFISKDDVIKFSKVASIEVLQSQLCSVFDMSALNVTQQLMQHQQSLVNSLDAYVIMKQDEANKQEISDEVDKDNTNTS